VENGVAIRNNLSVDQVDQRFETPRRVSQTKQRYSWTKERLAATKCLRQHQLFFTKCKLVKHRGALIICCKIPRRKNVRLKMQT